LPTFLLHYATAGLLALLGLAVPLAIHLWNRRPGRTVRVGSVRWLQAAANRRLRNLRLEQLWLLLLRAAIVALLALAVAGPFWQRTPPPQAVRGLVLLAPEVLRADVLPALRPSIDSLRRRGFTLRLFAPGFRPISTQAWAQPDSLALLAPPQALSSAAADDYWTRARQAADSFPGRPLRVVAGTTLSHFTGPRPALPGRLTWQPVPLPDSAVWLAQAVLSHPDTLRLTIGRSQEDGTSFRMLRLPRLQAAAQLTVAGLPNVQYQPGSPPTVQMNGQTAMPVQTEPLRILLYADANHAESGRHVRAALRAAALGLSRPLDIRNMASAEIAAAPLDNPSDWLFWLTDKPVPAAWLTQVRQGSQLWQEAGTLGSNTETFLDLRGLAEDAANVVVSRLDTSRATTDQRVVWQSGIGQPVLLRKSLGRGATYQLRTRLEASWSSLPESPALPELFLQLLRSESEPALASSPDLRQLDTRQLGAAVATNQASAGITAVTKLPSPTQNRELRTWVVLAALLLFALERGLAHHSSLSSSSV